MTVDEFKALLADRVSSYSSAYQERLNFELEEVEKQGAFSYFINLYEDKKRLANPNKLLIPWLLGVTPDDPLINQQQEILYSTKFKDVEAYLKKHGSLPVGFIKDPDTPDIDLDCIPEARDHIKAYAAERYGIKGDEYGNVCSVATWGTYLLKSAIVDVAMALPKGPDTCEKQEVYALTTNLPADVDQMKDGGFSKCKGKVINNGEEKDCGKVHKLARCPSCGSDETAEPTIGRLLEDFDELRNFSLKYPQLIEYAVRLVGKVRTNSMHAGALIITNQPLYGNIPLAKSKGKNGQWVSLWTEGRNTQLSKLGYIKWDILGLKTLQYIFNCCKLIQNNRNIYFGEPVNLINEKGEQRIVMDGWDDIYPKQNQAGFYYEDGIKKIITLNDPDALRLANECKTDAVFQFDTDLAKSILKNGVNNFNDLMIFNAMGHPGPMACVWSHSLVNTDKGVIEIRNVDPQQHKIFYINNSKKLSYTDKYVVANSGKKRLYKIKLKNGKIIKASADHRVLTNCGFKRVDQLRVGDGTACVDDSIVHCRSESSTQ